jgi:hypothetical protein
LGLLLNIGDAILLCFLALFEAFDQKLLNLFREFTGQDIEKDKWIFVKKLRSGVYLTEWCVVSFALTKDSSFNAAVKYYLVRRARYTLYAYSSGILLSFGQRNIVSPHLPYFRHSVSLDSLLYHLRRFYAVY